MKKTRDARVSPKGDPAKPACVSRVIIRAGAIAVVKSTESLNLWYRSGQSSSSVPSPTPLFFVSRRRDPSRAPPRRAGLSHTKLPGERTALYSLSSRAPGGLGDYVTCTFVHVRVSFDRQSGALLSPSLSLSCSPERESIMLNPAGSNETRHYEVRANLG